MYMFEKPSLILKILKLSFDKVCVSIKTQFCALELM